MNADQVTMIVLQSLDLILRHDTNDPTVKVLALIEKELTQSPQKVINFGNKQVDINLNLYSGRPFSFFTSKFLEEVRNTSNFKWHMYLNTGGKWKKKYIWQWNTRLC